MKQLRRLAGSSLALVLALGCLFTASPQPRYALAQGSDPGAQPAGRSPAAVGTGFTYQGQLTDGGAPANAAYDFVFELFSVETGGSHMGKLNFEDITVTDGLFTVQLDFGAGKFPGSARWLAIFVRPGDSDDPLAFVELSPRQPLTPAPYAIHAGSLDWGQAWTGSGTGLDLTGAAAAPILRATNTYTVTGGGIAGISTASNGVYGETASDNSEKAGVYGVSTDEASGVIGLSALGDGVVGDGGDGLGDFGGRFTGRAGVYGEGAAGAGGYFTSTGGDALHAEGDVTITGDLTVQGAANIPNYAQTVVVAKSGGDFATIQAAIDSITDATATKPYLVWAAPGVYSEAVTLKPFVHLQGAGQEATVITSNAGNSGLPATQATLKLSSSTSVRDLSIANTGSQAHNIALLGGAGLVDVLVAGVTVYAEGTPASGSNYGIRLATDGGAGSEVHLENVTARGESGGTSGACYGLYVDEASAIVHGGSYYGLAVDADDAAGIYVRGSGSGLVAEGVTALGTGGISENMGLWVTWAAGATVRGGEFTGRGGATGTGIYVFSTGSSLTATAVTALGEEGSYENYGLNLYSGSAATLYGGSFIGRTEGAYGIFVSGSTLEAEGVAASGEWSSSEAYGLRIVASSGGNAAKATLRGGSFRASTTQSTADACGISVYTSGQYGTLVAERVSLSANGSTNSSGLHTYGPLSMVEITNSVIRGEQDSLDIASGTVTVANSRLDGPVLGSPTCVGVSSGSSFYTNTCP